MAHLVNCFECGAKISSEVWICPKCDAPQCEYHCSICGQREEKSSFEKYNYEYYKKDHDGYIHVCTYSGLAHSECLKKVREEYSNSCKLFSSISYKCRLCGYKYDYFPAKDSCRECGHEIPNNDIKILRMTYPSHAPYPRGYICYRCKLPLIPVDATLIKCKISCISDVFYKYYDEYERCDSDFRIYSFFLHKTCYQNGQKEYDRMNYKEKNDCFLSTALYGEDSSKVRMLCFFRDEYLSASSLGRTFIALYVRLSPPLARAIANKSLLRSLVRYCIVAPALLFTEKFLAYAGRKDTLKHRQ